MHITNIDPDNIINDLKITNKNDIKTLEKFCKVYRAKGYNRFFGYCYTRENKRR